MVDFYAIMEEMGIGLFVGVDFVDESFFKNQNRKKEVYSSGYYFDGVSLEIYVLIKFSNY